MGSLLTPAQVQHYPGHNIHRPTFLCDRLMGPTILNGILPSGSNVEQMVRQRRWSRKEGGGASQAESEAVNLARAIHLMIMESRSLQAALEENCALEVLLRRLWCLLNVEEMAHQGSIPKHQAWEAVLPVLEHLPDANLHQTAVDTFVRREFAALSRFRTAASRPAPHASGAEE